MCGCIFIRRGKENGVLPQNERIFDFTLLNHNYAWERNVYRRAGPDVSRGHPLTRAYTGTTVFSHGIISGLYLPFKPLNLNYRRGLYFSLEIKTKLK